MKKKQITEVDILRFFGSKIDSNKEGLGYPECSLVSTKEIASDLELEVVDIQSAIIVCRSSGWIENRYSGHPEDNLQLTSEGLNRYRIQAQVDRNLENRPLITKWSDRFYTHQGIFMFLTVLISILAIIIALHPLK